jgi:hypothetical protein
MAMVCGSWLLLMFLWLALALGSAYSLLDMPVASEMCAGMFEGMAWRFRNATNLFSRKGDSHAKSFLQSDHGAL